VSSDVLSKQWKYCYEIGKAQNPPIAIATASSFVYLAWTVYSKAGLHPSSQKNGVMLYSAAAALVVGVVPLTLLAMATTNDKLSARAKQQLSTKSDDKEVGELLETWTFLNGVRSLFPLAACVAALAAGLA
jgi:hypothetical protein